ncbi:MAG: FkbM family methyltransferase [Nitrosospira sp.]|nr:FkbM family methyltransferase [Nitrosospira sp.]
MLWRALKHVENGFYIDVGANDPTLDSVTRAFYERGWNGINIEPLPSHHADLQRERPRDINLQCGAGAIHGEIELWECDVRGWSTADKSVAALHRSNGHEGIFHKIKVLPLSEICASNVNSEIHFLKIDVEGFEKSVIEGMDFSHFRPWILVIEATFPNSSEEMHDEWEGIVLSNGYLLAYIDGLNRFYVASEHSELLVALRYPPNVFDEHARFEQLNSEFRAQQAEATLRTVYCSRSWRILSPLRWLSFQSHLLQSLGVFSRSKALVSKISQLISQNTMPVRRIFLENNKYLSQSDLNKPRLVLDMDPLSQGIKTGIYRVCDELFPRLAKSGKFDMRYSMQGKLEVNAAAYLKTHDMHVAKIYSVEGHPSKYCDILLSPFGPAPKAWIEDSRIHHAHIIHDVIAIRHPEYFEQGAVAEVRNIVANLNKNTLIFAVSEFTKQDLLSCRPDLASNQIVVIPLAAGDSFRPCQSAEKKSVMREHYDIPPTVPYILSLATLEIRKNLNKVVESFLLYISQHPESQLHLVLAGMTGWKLDQLNQALGTAGSKRNRIILTGFVKDEHLSALYSDALCFLYLSKYEGFGLPPLEAMACGTPVICSNNSSLPEVVGSAGIMVDADDVDSVAIKIHQIMTNESYRAEFAVNGLARAEKFSWDNSANIVIANLCEYWDEK